MPLSIRDPRAAVLAKELATLRKTNMTAAIIQALENEISRDRGELPLAERLGAIAAGARAKAGPSPREVSEAERDAMWRR